MFKLCAAEMQQYTTCSTNFLHLRAVLTIFAQLNQCAIKHSTYQTLLGVGSSLNARKYKIHKIICCLFRRGLLNYSELTA